jgi:hypothetical protein
MLLPLPRLSGRVSLSASFVFRQPARNFTAALNTPPAAEAQALYLDAFAGYMIDKTHPIARSENSEIVVRGIGLVRCQKCCIKENWMPVASENSMTPQEYEQLVAETVIRDFQGFHDVTFYRNEKFPGVRQPGAYEVDVAAKIRIADSLSILTIFECKFLNRKVDRPIVQKLIQTRDAISAHKCVVVTNGGFTEEAMDVARAHGVGLWLVGKTTRITVMGAWGPDRIIGHVAEFRKEFAKLVGYAIQESADLSLLDDEYCHAHPDLELQQLVGGPMTRYAVALPSSKDWSYAFQYDGSKMHDDYSCEIMNVRFSMCHFMDDIFSYMAANDSPLQERSLELLDRFLSDFNSFLAKPIPPTSALSASEIENLFRSISLPLNGNLMSRENLRRAGAAAGINLFFDAENDTQLAKTAILGL